MSRPILAPYATRFHGPGMEDGPIAVADALEVHTAARETVAFALEAPPAEALPPGLRLLADAVAGSTDAVPVALLGECTLAPGAIAGAQRRVGARLGVVWIDAHGDLNTPATSPSGFLGGMPYAIALGLCHHELVTAAGLEPLAPSDCALVGARDLDPGEAALVAGAGPRSVADVADALAALPPDIPLYLHVDGDVLDPAVHPAVDFPVPGGWSEAALAAAIDAVLATGRVATVGVCWGNPRRAGAARSAAAARAALGALVR